MDDDLKRAIPRRLAGRIAPRLDAIADARSRDLSWPEIAAIIGPQLELDLADIRKAALRLQKGYVRARQAVDKGRLKVTPIAMPAPAPQAQPPTTGGFKKL